MPVKGLGKHMKEKQAKLKNLHVQTLFYSATLDKPWGHQNRTL